MRKNIFIVIFFILCSCSSFYSDSILVDGQERTFIVHKPKDYAGTASLPLVIVLHGGGGQGKGMIRLTGFDDVADANNFIAVYPDGLGRQWNDGREVNITLKNNREINDVLFISELIDTVISKYNADSNRIHVTGISNGGIMSYRLACELSGKIAAIAPVAASMTPFLIDHCTLSRKVPMMLIFGNEDPLVPFEGGQIKGKRGEVVSVEKCVKFWLKQDSCSLDASTVIIDSADDDTRAIKSSYSDNSGNTPVIFWLIEGGGHTWPGGLQYLPKLFIGRTSKQINASEEIWKFFKDKSLH